MYLWPEKCRRNHFSNGTVRELCSLLAEAPFSEDMDVLPFRDHLRAPYENWGIKNGGGLLEMELSWLNPSITSETMVGCTVQLRDSFGEILARRK